MATSSPRPRALIYVRISRDRTGGGLGVDRQETDCRALAERLGFDVGEVYQDNDLSAYSGKPRPAYKRMCSDLERGAATTVICWHTDRLHRSPKELEAWIDLAEPRGIVVRPVTSGEVDLATPSGRMQARIVGAVARHESEHKAQRIKAQKGQAAADGRWLGGRRPFGYGDDGVTLVPAEADLIRTGTETLLSGGSLRSVVRAWNDAGAATTTGKQWTHKAVRDVLGRWRNAGVLEHRGVPGAVAWPEIVTVDQVRAVREVLAENDARHSEVNQVGNRARWLLSGIARCQCGQVMRAVTSTTRDRCYRCTSYGPGGHVTRIAEPIDQLVTAVVAARLADPGLAGLITTTTDGVDVPALRAEVRKIRKRLGEIAVMLGDGDLSAAEAKTARGRATARLAAAEATLAAAVRTSALSSVAATADPVAAWEVADLDVRREIIRELMTITIKRQGPGRRPFYPDTVEIEWL